MRDVTDEATDVIDVGPYVASVPVAELCGHRVREIELVYRDSKNRYDHVLVATATKNVYLCVVVDLVWQRIHGHHLLDLNEKYGLPPVSGA
jgi:hypothetical protein